MIMLTRRVCPVIWPGNSGPLSDKQLDQYREQGYLFLPDCLGKGDPVLLSACVENTKLLLSSADRRSFITEENGSSIRSVFDAHRLNDAFEEAARYQFFVSAARQILGSDVYIHQTHVNYKQAFFGEHYFWHQDYAYWRNEDGMPSMRAIGVILFLTEVKPENGPLMFIPGSHQWEAPKIMSSEGSFTNTSTKHGDVGSLESHGLLTPDEIKSMCKNVGITTITGSVGGVILFDPNLAHASSDNLSPYDRVILLIYYNSTENKLIAPTRPEYISSRNFDPL
jgi:ectoine hydroxylase